MTASMAGALVSALGMVMVAVAAVAVVRRMYRPAYRWFWVGAALWTVAVVPKLIVGALITVPMLTRLNSLLPFQVYVVAGGVCMGVLSAVFEMGVTIGAGLIWRRLGRDVPVAVGIGAGAGAFEALLLGLAALCAMVAVSMGVHGTEEVGAQISTLAESTPLFWLIAPTERVTAVLAHTASRALVLLSIGGRRWWMAAAGVAIFTALDGIAGVVQVSDAMNRMSLWLVELSLAPAGVAALAALVWLHRRERGA